MNLKEQKKTERELEIFKQFAAIAPLLIDRASVRNETPPLPDISCEIDKQRHFFEMCEITDQDLARQTSLHADDDEIYGGSISHDKPLLYTFQSKASKRYNNISGPLELLAYYEKQVAPYFDAAFLSANVGTIANDMLASGNWDRIWIFDTWQKRILWQRGHNKLCTIAVNGRSSMPNTLNPDDVEAMALNILTEKERGTLNESETEVIRVARTLLEIARDLRAASNKSSAASAGTQT